MDDTPAKTARARVVRVVNEVLIIVVGVLLALGADSLRQDYSDRATAQRYMDGLAADLRRDSVEFEDNLAPTRLPAQAAAVDSLVAIIADAKRTARGSLILRYVNDSGNLPFAVKRGGTFADMVGSGRLELIDDPTLRASLVQYYSTPVFADQSAYEAYLATSYYPYIRRLTQVLGLQRMQRTLIGCDDKQGGGQDRCFDAASHGDELQLLRRDPEIPSLIWAQIIQRYLAENGVRAALHDAEGLLSQIDHARTRS